MTTVNALANTSATTAAQANSAISAVSKSFDKDTFLKLLVAQLKYQDPTKPTDTAEFMAQTAQFTLVEKFDQLAESNRALLTATQTQSATAMVGKAITWTDATGEHTGTVSAVTIAGGQPKLKVGGSEVEIASVTEVRTA